MSSIKIEKFAAYKGPDGTIHATREECRQGVIKAVVAKEMRDLAGGSIYVDDVIEAVTEKFDKILREVDEVMKSV